jgi:hypothetical protein
MAGEGVSGDRERRPYAWLIGQLDEKGVPTEGSLLAYAAREFALGAQLEDGSTQRDHVLSEYRQTKQWPEGWEPVECPNEVLYLWEYFASMNTRRTSSGFGPNPISEGELASWAARRRIVLEPFENRALDALEFMYLRSQAKKK